MLGVVGLSYVGVPERLSALGVRRRLKEPDNTFRGISYTLLSNRNRKLLFDELILINIDVVHEIEVGLT